LHALRERGVEYVEVRCMDLNPFLPVGIDQATARFLDIFLLHCLLHDSPPDTPQEIVELARNQQRTAARGREPGLTLERRGQEVLLTDWAREVMGECEAIATTLDVASGTAHHREAWQAALNAVNQPDTLPSARVLQAMKDEHSQSHIEFVRARSEQTRQALLEMPWSADQQAHFERLAQESLDEQTRIEASDTMPFEFYRREYLALRRLEVAKRA